MRRARDVGGAARREGGLDSRRPHESFARKCRRETRVVQENADHLGEYRDHALSPSILGRRVRNRRFVLDAAVREEFTESGRGELATIVRLEDLQELQLRVQFALCGNQPVLKGFRRLALFLEHAYPAPICLVVHQNHGVFVAAESSISQRPVEVDADTTQAFGGARETTVEGGTFELGRGTNVAFRHRGVKPLARRQAFNKTLLNHAPQNVSWYMAQDSVPVGKEVRSWDGNGRVGGMTRRTRGVKERQRTNHAAGVGRVRPKIEDGARRVSSVRALDCCKKVRSQCARS